MKAAILYGNNDEEILHHLLVTSVQTMNLSLIVSGG